MRTVKWCYYDHSVFEERTLSISPKYAWIIAARYHLIMNYETWSNVRHSRNLLMTIHSTHYYERWIESLTFNLLIVFRGWRNSKMIVPDAHDASIGLAGDKHRVAEVNDDGYKDTEEFN